MANITRPAPVAGTTHFLLLLADSALPLGSFAFSSGLESYLAHTASRSPVSLFTSSFLPLSVSSYASTTLPFVLAAYRAFTPAAYARSPEAAATTLAELDDALDAAVVCAVGRRASVAQGRALLSIWERSLAAALPSSSGAKDALKLFSAMLRSSPAATAQPKRHHPPVNGGGPQEEGEEEEWTPDPLPPASAHLAPLFGAVAALLGLGGHQTAYVFMLGHVKAVVSAAVRAAVLGPYQAQRVLAGVEVQALIAGVIEREWETAVEKAGQSVLVVDLWIGRHELLYSRIFNS